MAKKQDKEQLEDQQDEVLTGEERTNYPAVFPLVALEDIKRIILNNTIESEMQLFAKSVWELEGSVLRIFIGSDQRIVPAAIDPLDIGNQLYQLRELLHRVNMSLKLPGNYRNLSEDNKRLLTFLVDKSLVLIQFSRKAISTI